MTTSPAAVGGEYCRSRRRARFGAPGRGPACARSLSFRPECTHAPGRRGRGTARASAVRPISGTSTSACLPRRGSGGVEVDLGLVAGHAVEQEGGTRRWSRRRRPVVVSADDFSSPSGEVAQGGVGPTPRVRPEAAPAGAVGVRQPGAARRVGPPKSCLGEQRSQRAVGGRASPAGNAVAPVSVRHQPRRGCRAAARRGAAWRAAGGCQHLAQRARAGSA